MTEFRTRWRRPLRWCNGFSPEQRGAITPIQNAAVRKGTLIRPTICSICGFSDPTDPKGRGYLSPPSTTTLLDRWLEISGITEGPIFQSLHLRRPSELAMQTSSIRRLVKRAATRAGPTLQQPAARRRPVRDPAHASERSTKPSDTRSSLTAAMRRRRSRFHRSSPRLLV